MDNDISALDLGIILRCLEKEVELFRCTVTVVVGLMKLFT